MLIEQSVQEWMTQLSSKSPVPGGGSCAAVAAAMGLGLANMVVSLTMGKKKYQSYEEELQQLYRDGCALQDQILLLVEEDAAAFAPLAKAYSLPKATEEERALKQATLSAAAESATQPPLAVLKKGVEALTLTLRIAEIGNPLALSDAACAAHMLQAAMHAAKYNVWINLPLIDHPSFVAEAKLLLAECLQIAEELVAKVLALVETRMHA